MKSKKSKNSLERQLYISFFLVSALITLLSLGVTLYYDITRQQKEMDAVISGTSAYIASMPDVISMLENGYPDSQAKLELDSLCRNIPDISVVVICDRNGLRFYHTDRQKSGETYVAGDETRILDGSPPYITTGYGTKGSQRRAFHSINNDQGQIIGFVMASVFTSHISDRLKSIFLMYAAVLCFMLFTSVILTRAIVRYLRKSLMGFHPDELLAMYLQQDEMLNSLEEGLVASSPVGTVLYANQAAKRIFAAAGDTPVGRPLKEVYPETRMETILQTGLSEHSRSCVIGGHTVIVNELLIRDGKKPAQGILTILFDKTETLRISDELSGTRSMLDTFRAFNHEFLNKLHIILGYLQTGETERAMDFIINSSLVSSQSIRQTADCIRVSKLCALVIGKMMHAAELGTLLTLSQDSCCMEEDLLLPVDAYATILGNLLENAVDALSGSQAPVREIKLGIYCRPDCSILICEDTGPGIPPDLLEHIFEKGVSTKGEMRGTGLHLIRQITDTYGGEITVDTETDEGTCFTLTFTRKEEDGTCIRQ